MHEVKLDGVEVLWYGHASFRISDGNRLVYVDPFVIPDDIEQADMILVTHEHFDHCHEDNTARLKKHDTIVIASQSAANKLGFGKAMHPGQQVDFGHLKVEAVEAYNTNKFRSPGHPFHPRGLGVGFVLTIGGKNIYHAGDTDSISEMSLLHNKIDAALLPIGGTYTMNVHEAAEAAQVIKPKHLIPMHYNSDKYGVAGISANPVDLAKALVGKGIMVRILDPLV